MSLKVGINGFGRIGRLVMRAALKSGADLDFVAVNDLTDTKTLAHLFKYDSVHGIFDGDVKATDEGISVNGDEFKVLSERDPGKLPWKDLGADVVLECTGIVRPFRQSERAPRCWRQDESSFPNRPKGDVKTIVVGVNDDEYDPNKHKLLSNASCTTNCLAPLCEGARREVRDRARVDDHHPRLHERPKNSRPSPLRPASSSRGSHVDDSDQNRRRRSGLAGVAEPQRETDRRRDPRSGLRLSRWSTWWPNSTTEATGGTDQRRDQRGRRRGTQGNSSSIVTSL